MAGRRVQPGIGSKAIPDGRGFFDDLEITDRSGPQFTSDEPEAERAPEALKRVTVLAPFSVSYQGTAYWPGSTPEIPESLAHKWIQRRWVADDIGD
jgi:hypothetical protein